MLDELQQALADKEPPSFDGPETLVADSPANAAAAYSETLAPTGAPITPKTQLPIPPTQQTPPQQFPHLPVSTQQQTPSQRTQQPAPTQQPTALPQQQPIALPQQQPIAPPQQQPITPPQQQPTALPRQFAQPAPTQQPTPSPQQHPVFQQGPGQPGQSSPMAANFGSARFGEEALHAVPAAVVPYQDSLTEKVAALPAPEALRHTEDWDESLITVLLVFGVLLIACFVAPWSIGSGKTPTVFAWSIFTAKHASIGEIIVTSMIAVTGLSAIGVGSLRLSGATRSLLALSIGLVPIAATIATADTIPWRGILSSIGTVLIVSALLLRTRYVEHLLPRVIASVAALMLLALYFVPIGGQIPATALLDAIAANPGATKILPIIGFSVGPLTLGILPFTVILLSFLVWLPGSHRTVLTAIAMMLLFALFVAGLCQPLLGDNVVANLKSGLASYLFTPLAKTAWIAMASYGLRGMLDQKLS